MNTDRRIFRLRHALHACTECCMLVGDAAREAAFRDSANVVPPSGEGN
jgi:hypothetical protein